MGWQQFWSTVTDPRVVASYRLTLGTAFFAACVNAVFGLLAAWVLVRYSFPGRRIVDALVDLPFALPTAVAGITLTTLYAPKGLLGAPLQQLGIKVAFTPLGIVVSLIFIGLPFVIRTLEPVIEDLSADVEEAATSLGASRWQVIRRVILPYLYPAWLTGFALAFARAIGEYGSVVFISGNMPMKTRNLGPADHHETGAVRLCRCDGHRRGDAVPVVRPSAAHQRAAGMERAARDAMTTPHLQIPDTRVPPVNGAELRQIWRPTA